MMDKQDKKKLCMGCNNNFYNQVGNSTSGECWSLENAKVVQLTKVGVWQNPPYKWEPQTTLNCHSPNGERWLPKTDERMRG